MTTALQAAAIEFNTLHDFEALVAELQGMAKFDTSDDLYCTPVSGDMLRKIRMLGVTWATVLANKWSETK